MQKNIFLNQFFVGIFKVNDEKRRIRLRIHQSEAWIRGSGYTPKCHGSATLIKAAIIMHLLIYFIYLQLLFGKCSAQGAALASEHQPTGGHGASVHRKSQVWKRVKFRVENDQHENLIISGTLLKKIRGSSRQQRCMQLKIEIICYGSSGCLHAVETGLGRYVMPLPLRYVMPLRILAKTIVQYKENKQKCS